MICIVIILGQILVLTYWRYYLKRNITFLFLSWNCILNIFHFDHNVGQIELFSHVPVLKNFVEHLKRKNFNVCAVYLLDSQVCNFKVFLSYHPQKCCGLFFTRIVTDCAIYQFMTDITKFISGCMASLSAMVQLELPHINILSKMDLVTKKRDIEEYVSPSISAVIIPFSFIFIVYNSNALDVLFENSSFLNPEPQVLLSELNQRMAPQFSKLNKALIELVSCLHFFLNTLLKFLVHGWEVLLAGYNITLLKVYE